MKTPPKDRDYMAEWEKRKPQRIVSCLILLGLSIAIILTQGQVLYLNIAGVLLLLWFLSSVIPPDQYGI